jgi:hypothetical protein
LTNQPERCQRKPLLRIKGWIAKNSPPLIGERMIFGRCDQKMELQKFKVVGKQKWKRYHISREKLVTTSDQVKIRNKNQGSHKRFEQTARKSES